MTLPIVGWVIQNNRKVARLAWYESRYQFTGEITPRNLTVLHFPAIKAEINVRTDNSIALSSGKLRAV